MKFYTIEVDEKVWNYLKKNAEPFKDTPNSVLNRLIFSAGKKPVSKITAPPRPYEKASPKIEINPEQDLTIDGIKLELEKQLPPKENETTAEKNFDEFLVEPKTSSQPKDLAHLELELDSKFETDRIVVDNSFKPDKDIDDFINELEKTNESVSLRDEFSSMLDELNTGDDEWQEMPIQPKQNFTLEDKSISVQPVANQSTAIKKPQAPPKIAEKKKPKLLSFEDKLVYSLGERLKNQWGEFRQEGVGLLIFANKTVLCKYSKYDDSNAKWFWGVSQADRYAWSPQNWLALILENEDKSSFSFLLFNSQESGVLFDQCVQNTGDKYINMLIDDSYESIRIQEWRHLDLRDRKKALPLFEPEDE